MITVYTEDEFTAALQTVKAEFAAKVGARPQLTIEETMEIREYAKSRTDLVSHNLTAEQAAWNALYDGLTEELRSTTPDVMAEVEPLEKQMASLQSLQTLMKAKLDAHPNDFGYRVPLGFLIVGGLIGWFINPSLWSVIGSGLASWIAGMFVAVFVTDSAKVQSDLAIRMNRVGLKRTAHWLYTRALTVR
jgi:hypothetical protein